MDRRRFFALTAAATAGTAVSSETLPLSRFPFLDAIPGQGQRPAPAAGVSQAAVRITSEFMEDYTPGMPWSAQSADLKNEPAAPLRFQFPHVSHDGSKQFFTTFRQPGDQGADYDQHAVNRLYAEPDGVTGWNNQQRIATDDGVFFPSNFYPGLGYRFNELIHFGSGFWPQIVLLGRSNAMGASDAMWVYRPYSISQNALYDDGSWSGQMAGAFYPGPLASGMPKIGSMPLVTGQLPRGSQYLLEYANFPPPPSDPRLATLMDAMTRTESSQKSKYLIRNLGDIRTAHWIADDVFTYPAGWANNLGGQPFEGMKVFPLTGTGYPDNENFYRCIVMTKQGDVFYISLKDVGSFGNPFVAQLGEKKYLGNSPMKCVYVREQVSDFNPTGKYCIGQVDVMIFDFPNVTTMPAEYTEDPLSLHWFYPVIAPYRSRIPEVEQIGHKPNHEYSVLGTWDAPAERIEIFVLDRDTSQPGGPIDVWTTGCRMPVGYQNGGSNQGPQFRPVMGMYPWDELVLIDRGCNSVDIFPSSDPCLLIGKFNVGYEILSRNDDGDWDSDQVRVPSEGREMLDIASYRVGINISLDGVPLGGELLQITASEPSSVVMDQMEAAGTVGQSHLALSIHRPTKAYTDANGAVWINVLLQDRLCFPTLYAESPRFKDGKLAFNLNHSIENFFVNLNEEKLLNATDPKSGIKVMSKPHNVTTAVKAVTSLMQYEEKKEAAVQSTIPGTLALTSDLPAMWVPVSEVRTAPRRQVLMSGDSSWHIRVLDGVLHFETLSHEEAGIRRANLRSSLVPREIHPDFFSDIGDALGSVADAVWDGLVSVSDAVLDIANQTLTLVLEGVSFVIDGILDTVERIMDAISIVLDMAGFVLGMAVNWILEQLGFLFDWKEIKLRRDKMKKMLYDHASVLTRGIPDPRDGAKFFADQLDGLRSWLLQYRSSPAANATYGSSISSHLDLPDIFSVSGLSVMPQVTWLMDKLRARLFNSLDGPVSPELIDFAKPQSTAISQLMQSSAKINLSIDDLQTLVISWVTNADIFSGEAFRPLLDLVLQKLDAVIQLVKESAIAVGEMLRVLWLHPEKIVGWFDATIPIPFVNGFYRGLTGNELSLLDVFCLVASIKTVVMGNSFDLAENEAPDVPNMQLPVPWAGHGRLRHHLASGGPHLELASLRLPKVFAATESPTAQAASSFALAAMSIGVITSGLDAGFIALGESKNSRLLNQSRINAVGKLNLAGNLISGICLAIAAGELKDAEMVDRVMASLIPFIVETGLIIGFIALPALDQTLFPDRPGKQGYSKNVLADLFTNGINIYSLVRDVQRKDDLGIAASTINLTKSLLIAGVRQYAELKGPVALPLGPFVVGSVVGGLTAWHLGVYSAEFHEIIQG